MVTLRHGFVRTLDIKTKDVKKGQRGYLYIQLILGNWPGIFILQKDLVGYSYLGGEYFSG